MVGISNTTNKAQFGKETNFGESVSNFNLNLGLVQSFSFSENENIQKLKDITSKHFYSKFEGGIYYINGSLETQITKISLPNILETFLGKKSIGTESQIVGDVEITDELIQGIGSRLNNPFILDIDGEEVKLAIDFSNLTKTEFLYLVQGQLNNHTIEYNEDGKILIRKNDLGSHTTSLGSSNDEDTVFGSNPILIDGTDDPVKYKVVSNPLETNSYSVNAEYTKEKFVTINGLVVKDATIEFNKENIIIFKMNYVAKKLQVKDGTIATISFPDTSFLGLDSYGVYNNSNIFIDSFNCSINWGVNDTEGRTIEKVEDGERRQIKRVIKHLLEVNGSMNIEVDNSFEIGYNDNVESQNLNMTIKRGENNEHKFLLQNTIINTKNMTINKENQKRIIDANFDSQNISVIGDL